MTSEMIARIDAWIADQPGYVSRQDAVRYCVEFALFHGDPEPPGVTPSKPVVAATAYMDTAE